MSGPESERGARAVDPGDVLAKAVRMTAHREDLETWKDDPVELVGILAEESAWRAQMVRKMIDGGCTTEQRMLALEAQMLGDAEAFRRLSDQLRRREVAWPREATSGDDAAAGGAS